MGTRLILLLLVLALLGVAFYHKSMQDQIAEATKSTLALARTPLPQPTSLLARSTPRPTVPPTPETGGQVVKGTAGYPFIAYLPKGYGSVPGQKWPVLVYLHGQGMGQTVDNALNYGPIRYGRILDVPLIVVAPATQSGWNITQLDSFLGGLPFPGIDPDRIYLSGYSMGAHALWLWIVTRPEKFAAIAPFAGAGSPRDARKRLSKDLGVWIFHGMKDDIVPAQRGLMMIGALKDEGLPVKYTLYQDGDHSTVLKGYEDPEFYQWLLQFHRPGPKKKGGASVEVNSEPEKSTANANRHGRPTPRSKS